MSYVSELLSGSDRHVALPFSAIRLAIECREVGLTVGDLHSAIAPPYQPALRCWMMGLPPVLHTTRWEIQDWLSRRAEHVIAERTAWIIRHSSEASLDIARLVA